MKTIHLGLIRIHCFGNMHGHSAGGWGIWSMRGWSIGLRFCHHFTRIDLLPGLHQDTRF